jgi:serine/threonine-protein kinase PknG
MTTATCTQPGCGGTIEDGFCNVCGLAPAPAAPAAAAGSGGAGFAGPGSGGTGSGGTGPASTGSGSAGSGSTGSGSTGSGGVTFGSGTYGSGGSGSSGTGSRRGSRSRPGSRPSRHGIGGGLVTIPPIPARDPASAVLTHPEVPENRRYCGNCGQPVGRSAGGRPGRTEGFCRNCGTRFSFTPKLTPGELVAHQYEVLGCLAHGGLGWIYLARDRRVNDMWVVLKGLLNTGDADAMAAALVERDALSKVKHPNIVQVYNYVEHTSGDGETTQYIVMEYVGGESLKQIRLQARQQGGAVPLSHAIAYMIEILPALGYLHENGLVYCDFKPDNVIQTEQQLKLIDMGGVRRIDGDGPIYGTVGYQAPEIETEGPSPSSDLYTVGRALAVLTFDFPGYQGEYKYRLPDSVPLLAGHESFARTLRKATHPDPERRFQTAGEMAEQLTGVLREVLATGDGQPRPAFSGVFSPELLAVGTDLTPARREKVTVVDMPPAADVAAGLPAPLVDGTDPAAGFLATLGGLEPGQQANALMAAVGAGAAGSGASAVSAGTGTGGTTASVPAGVAGSAETRLALARALIMAGTPDGAAAYLAELAADDPSDWRIAWYNGLRELVSGRPAVAGGAFSAVFDELPGELAPKLALAFAAEAAGEAAIARRYYSLVWAVDRSYISAAFGLARTCVASGDQPAAVAALAAVPDTSSQYAAAQIAAVRLLVSGGDGVSADDLRQADGRLGRLRLDDVRRQQLVVEILHAALDWVSVGTPAGAAAAPPGAAPPGVAGALSAGDGRILGCEPNERALRFGLERGYRALASLTPDPARKVELVDMANEIRPRTWT